MMPRTESLKLGEFMYLIPDEQQMTLYIVSLEDHMVTGKAESVGYVTNSNVNNRNVIRVEALDNILKVWVEDENA